MSYLLVETITSAYDKMSEIDAFNILKKKILKGENLIHYVHIRKFLRPAYHLITCHSNW